MLRGVTATVHLDEARNAVLDEGTLAPCVVPFIARMGGELDGDATFEVALRTDRRGRRDRAALRIIWERARLAWVGRELEHDVQSLLGHTHALTERATEYAGYAVALCAIRAFLPGRVVVSMNVLDAPDFQFNAAGTRGVEVAARFGGRPAVAAAVREKRRRLRAVASLVEGHVSVWGLRSDARQGVQERVV